MALARLKHYGWGREGEEKKAGETSGETGHGTNS